MRVDPKLIRLEAGGHPQAEAGQPQGACVMELAALATGERNMSDMPACTEPIVSRAAQRVWDYAPKSEHPALVADFLPRLIRARRLDAAGRVRLRDWCVGEARAAAERTLVALRRDLPDVSPEVTRLVETVEAMFDVYARYLTGEASWSDLMKARDAVYVARRALWERAEVAVAVAVAAAVAAELAEVAAAVAAAAAEVAVAAAVAVAEVEAADPYVRHSARVDFLDRLLDRHEKELVDTDAGLWVPEAWEQHALEFVEALCSAND